MTQNYFPLVVASGAAFCNRVKERAYLGENIQSNRHTLILAPRRYGKTSLALKVLEENAIPKTVVDFFSITDLDTVFTVIQRAVQELLGNILPVEQKILNKLQAFFGQFHPSIELALAGQKIKLNRDTKKIIPADITELLLGVESLAKDLDKKIVIMMDEFQQLFGLNDSFAIEGAIRHAVERSQYVCYVFSGSTRHILQNMFDDSERPLYRSCDKLSLKRIHQKDYQLYINKAAKKKWDVSLSDEIINKIFELSELHPYYLNMLCSRLWGQSSAPNLRDVNAAWENYVQEEKVRIIQDFVRLSVNQRAMLLGLAAAPEKEPTGSAFLASTKLSSSSANQALNTLLKKDYVYLNEKQCYQILDPVMKVCLANVVSI